MLREIVLSVTAMLVAVDADVVKGLQGMAIRLPLKMHDCVRFSAPFLPGAALRIVREHHCREVVKL